MEKTYVSIYIGIQNIYFNCAQFPPTQPLGHPGEGEIVHTTSELVTFNNLAPLRVRSIPPAHRLTIIEYEMNKEFVVFFFSVIG